MLEQATNRQAIARSQLGVSEARVAQARAAVAQAQAAVDRIRGGVRQRHHPLAHPRHRPVARRRNRQPGVVHPQPRLVGHARDGARRHQPGVRQGQGGRDGHRPGEDGAAGAHPGRDVQGPRVRGPRDARSRRWASRRTTSSTSRCGRRSTTRAGCAREHDVERRDRPRGAQGHADRPRARRHLRRQPRKTFAERLAPASKTGRERVPSSWASATARGPRW